jgi:hypothetical protein
MHTGTWLNSTRKNQKGKQIFSRHNLGFSIMVVDSGKLQKLLSGRLSSHVNFDGGHKNADRLKKKKSFQENENLKTFF